MTSTAVNNTTQQRRVALGTVIGTTIEWYDFFIYSTAAGLVFVQLFFKPAGEELGCDHRRGIRPHHLPGPAVRDRHHNGSLDLPPRGHSRGRGRDAVLA